MLSYRSAPDAGICGKIRRALENFGFALSAIRVLNGSAFNMAVTRLTAVQLRALNQVVLELHDAVQPLDFEFILDQLAQLLPVSSFSVDEAVAFDQVVHRAERHLEPIPQVAEKVARYCPDNPVVAYAMRVGFAPPLRISDFATFREVKRTGYYNEMLRYLSGWRDQAAIAIRLPKSILGFGLNRDRTFSDEELLVLELLHPHLERALRRCTQYLSLATERPLTVRQREVLHWVAEGKRDQEIALILRIAERTVEQHVRTCLSKLGVETRAAATAAVWRARGL